MYFEGASWSEPFFYVAWTLPVAVLGYGGNLSGVTWFNTVYMLCVAAFPFVDRALRCCTPAEDPRKCAAPRGPGSREMRGWAR